MYRGFKVDKVVTKKKVERVKYEKIYLLHTEFLDHPNQKILGDHSSCWVIPSLIITRSMNTKYKA